MATRSPPEDQLHQEPFGVEMTGHSFLPTPFDNGLHLSSQSQMHSLLPQHRLHNQNLSSSVHLQEHGIASHDHRNYSNGLDHGVDDVPKIAEHDHRHDIARQDLQRHPVQHHIQPNVDYNVQRGIKHDVHPSSAVIPGLNGSQHVHVAGFSPSTPQIRMLPTYLNSAKYPHHIQPQLEHIHPQLLPHTLSQMSPLVHNEGLAPASNVAHVPNRGQTLVHAGGSYIPSNALHVPEEPFAIDPLAGIHVMGPNHTSLSHMATSLPQDSHSLPPGLDPSTFGETPVLRNGLFELVDDKSRKVAPRSKDLFRVGPPFGITNIHRPLFCASTKEQIFPELESRIDRGFELGEAGNWIGYKRNYFTMVLTFNFRGWNLDRFTENQYEVLDKNDPSRRLPVRYFALSVLAKCSDPEVSIGLVQHTPKRDKGPQYSPPVYPAVPGNLPDHQTVKASCNKRNQKKIQTLGRIFSFDRTDYYDKNAMDPAKDRSVLSGYPSDEITRVARFERIQFTASIRVKQANHNIHKYFTLNVELLAIVEDADRTLQIPVASCGSAPLLIRGRSPSNYPREKTSGYRGKLASYE